MAQPTKIVVNLSSGSTQTVTLTNAEILDISNRANVEAARAAAVVPNEVSMWQARVVLRQAGLFDAAQAAVNSANDIALTEVWERGNYVLRDSPAIIALGAQLGLSDAQIDDLFRQAYTLKV